MKVYIAGKLRTDFERNMLEKIDSLCKEEGFETFLPHRDVGLAKDIGDVNRIFEGDIIHGFEGCDLIIALLDGLSIGAGTAWELGYAYANKIPAIGIKTDEPVSEALETLSAILISSMPIVESFEDLKKKILEFSQKA